MSDGEGSDDECEEQPIKFRGFIIAPKFLGSRNQSQAHHVMATRQQELQLKLDVKKANQADNNSEFGTPRSVETITPTPRASKFTDFGQNNPENTTYRENVTPSSVGSAASPGATSAPNAEGAEDELVEIKVRRRKPVEVERQANTSLNASAFDDTPAAEVYDPSWNTLPFRCEAGQLRHGRNTAAKAPVLPGAFRMNTVNEDEEEEDFRESAEAAKEKSENERREKEAAAIAKLKQGSASPVKKTEGITERQRAALGRLFIKRKNAKDGGSPSSGSSPRVELKLKKANRNAIESTRESKAAMHHLSVILQCDYQAEIVAHKSSEMRVRVPIAVAGEASPHLVVVSASDLPNKSGSKMTFRRSLTDISRISQEEFYAFVEGVNRRFRKLEGGTKTKSRR